ARAGALGEAAQAVGQGAGIEYVCGRAALVGVVDLDPVRERRQRVHLRNVLLDAALDQVPGHLIQGRVEKDVSQMDALTPFAHWIQVHHADEGCPTANILYPRPLPDRLRRLAESSGPR